MWDIVGALPTRSSAAPTRASPSSSLGAAAVHLARGGDRVRGRAPSSGIALAAAFVHSGLLERAFVPYVIASQTIPIVALAPMIVFALGQGVASVVVIATYLTFFPVTIAMIRGLRSPDPRALELMRCYAASSGASSGSCGCRRRCRTCSRR